MSGIAFSGSSSVFSLLISDFTSSGVSNSRSVSWIRILETTAAVRVDRRKDVVPGDNSDDETASLSSAGVSAINAASELHHRRGVQVGHPVHH